MKVSEYWALRGKTPSDRTKGRTYRLGRCNECCTGDRCDDPTHRSRERCPFCLGTGEVPEPTREEIPRG